MKNSKMREVIGKAILPDVDKCQVSIIATFMEEDMDTHPCT